jgi:hypothetical protein
MSYSEALDDERKYHLNVATNGGVSITRHGQDWIENPEGANAWIAAADQLETLRQENKRLQELVQQHDRNIYLVLEDRKRVASKPDEATFTKLAVAIAEDHGLSIPVAVNVLRNLFDKLENPAS